MIAIMKAEHLKLAHSFSRKVPFAVSILTLSLALFLTLGIYAAFPAGAWNWWYTLMMHGMLAIFCYFSIKKDKKIHYYHSLSLSVAPEKCWLGKIMYCVPMLFFSNLIIFIGTFLGGMILGTTIPAANGLTGAVLLGITCLWEIPFFLFLSAKSGVFGAVITGIVLPLAAVVGIADTPLWWVCPAAVPMRLMCPVLGILPNGLLIEPDNLLNDPNVILPGILLSLLWFVLFTFVTALWFQRKESV